MTDAFAPDADFSDLNDELDMAPDEWIAKMLG